MLPQLLEKFTRTIATATNKKNKIKRFSFLKEKQNIPIPNFFKTYFFKTYIFIFSDKLNPNSKNKMSENLTFLIEAGFNKDVS